MEQKIEMRKMRDFSAKINATFEFLRQNFKPLFKAIAYIAGPAILAQGVVYGYYNRSVINLTAAGQQGDGIFSFLGEFSLLQFKSVAQQITKSNLLQNERIQKTYL